MAACQWLSLLMGASLKSIQQRHLYKMLDTYVSVIGGSTLAPMIELEEVNRGSDCVYIYDEKVWGVTQPHYSRSLMKMYQLAKRASSSVVFVDEVGGRWRKLQC